MLGYSLEINWPVGTINHSPQSGVEVKNECIYTSSAGIFLHGVDKENFTFKTST